LEQIMATFRIREKRDGSKSVTARVRIGGVEETKTFSTKTAAKQWAKHREVELKEKPHLAGSEAGKPPSPTRSTATPRPSSPTWRRGPASSTNSIWNGGAMSTVTLSGQKTDAPRTVAIVPEAVDQLRPRRGMGKALLFPSPTDPTHRLAQRLGDRAQASGYREFPMARFEAHNGFLSRDGGWIERRHRGCVGP
jgi:hypothetical protein